MDDLRMTNVGGAETHEYCKPMKRRRTIPPDARRATHGQPTDDPRVLVCDRWSVHPGESRVMNAYSIATTGGSQVTHELLQHG